MTTDAGSATSRPATVRPGRAAAPSGEAPTTAWNARGWRHAEVVVAGAGTFITGLRVGLPFLLTVGAVLALVTAPVWFPVTRRYVGARLCLLVGLLSLPAGLLLSALSADDHAVQTGQAIVAISLIVGLLAGFGFLLWARERLGTPLLLIIFGLGSLAGVTPDELFLTNPWKFGFSLPVTLIVLGVTLLSRRKALELGVVGVLVVVSALTDARSQFAFLVLTLALLAWQLRPRLTTARASAARVVLGLVALAAVVYNLGEALILGGVFGQATQARSVEQLDASGSLILGGRPEIAATLALMRDNPFGFGFGVAPSLHDIAVAKTGMAAIGYDPNNGYVENFMFGRGFALHSVLGDLWAQAGLVGMAFGVLVAGLLLTRLGASIGQRLARAALLYLAFRTLWNLFFGPWFSSSLILALTLAVVLAERAPALAPEPPAEAVKAARLAEARARVDALLGAGSAGPRQPPRPRRAAPHRPGRARAGTGGGPPGAGSPS